MKQPTVVITGASKGIGRATALYLAARGWRVFAGVRKEADGEALKREAGWNLSPIILDVGDEETVHRAAELVAAQTSALAGLVNNAGIAVAGPLEFLPLEAFREQLEVNVTGQLAVTQAFMPLLRQARGRIVMMSSIGGRISTPMQGPYHASKFALEALSDALRLELSPWGIRVVLVEPGTIATPIWETSLARADGLIAVMPERARELYGEQYEATRQSALRTGQQGIPPERVAEVVEKALSVPNPRARYLVGRDAQVAARIAMLPACIKDRLLRPASDTRLLKNVPARRPRPTSSR